LFKRIEEMSAAIEQPVNMAYIPEYFKNGTVDTQNNNRSRKI